MDATDKQCANCANRHISALKEPYCAAVMLPDGLVLRIGHPEECGEERVLWKKLEEVPSNVE